MTSEEKIRALLSYRMEQAREALRAAEMNLEAGLVRSASNRAYYAMFYAVLALLAGENKETSRHSAAIALFDREFVKPGNFSRDLSRWLHDGFAIRQQADYAPRPEVTADQAREAVGHAREFVRRVDGFLEQRFPPLRSTGEGVDGQRSP